MKKIVSVLLVIALLLSLSTFAYAAEIKYIVPPEQANHKVCKVVAHRGLSSIAPENTLAAFELAGKMGYTHIELDIYPTIDEKWVVMHDPTIDRMTDKSGVITEMTFAQTQECVIDSGNKVADYKTQKIPTLEQVLSVCDKYNITPVIEIKGGTGDNIKQLANLISEYKNYDKFVFISFNENYICQLKALLPEITIFWLISKVKEEDIAYCLEHNIDGIDFNYKQTDLGLIEKILSANLVAGAWTVDSADDFNQLCSLNVDFITTNSIIGRENDCKHICHSNNKFLKFVWSIISYFINYSGEQKYCSCYLKH